MSYKVEIAQAKRTIEVPTGATILWAALDNRVDYPFGCQSGNCGACKSHLLKGEVAMEGYSEFALSDDEKARGLILACRAVPEERLPAGVLVASVHAVPDDVGLLRARPAEGVVPSAGVRGDRDQRVQLL